MKTSLAFTLGVGAVLAGVVPAVAAEPAVTGQARATNAVFLADTPAPSAPGAVCVIDSGLNLTPDTQGMTVLDGMGLPTPFGDVAVNPSHGTAVASMIGAPRNGWGGVGFWPQARVYVLAMPYGPGGVMSSAYNTAIRRCAAFPGVTVINISLGTPDMPADVVATTADAVAYVQRDYGVSVIAAAGNSGGGIEAPARAAGIIPVAASDTATGGVCDWSASAPGVLAAPGCGDVTISSRVATVDENKYVGGTSVAAPQAAALLAALRAYNPALTREQAEAALITSATPGPGGVRVINAAAAFRAAGLGHMVPAGTPDTPPAPAAAPAPTASAPAPGHGGTDAQTLTRGTMKVTPAQARAWRPTYRRGVSSRFATLLGTGTTQIDAKASTVGLIAASDGGHGFVRLARRAKAYRTQLRVRHTHAPGLTKTITVTVPALRAGR